MRPVYGFVLALLLLCVISGCNNNDEEQRTLRKEKIAYMNKVNGLSQEAATFRRERDQAQDSVQTLLSILRTERAVLVVEKAEPMPPKRV